MSQLTRLSEYKFIVYSPQHHSHSWFLFNIQFIIYKRLVPFEFHFQLSNRKLDTSLLVQVKKPEGVAITFIFLIKKSHFNFIYPTKILLGPGKLIVSF
jgi:hypothetical protein